jgi:hypothetical protein
MDNVVAQQQNTPDVQGASRKRSKTKNKKPVNKTIDTSSAVISLCDVRYVYDQIKIVSKFAKEIEVDINDLVLDTVIEPENMASHVYADILRVVRHDKKYHILTGGDLYLKALADESATTVSVTLVSVPALGRTELPPKPLTKEELEDKLKNSGLLKSERHTAKTKQQLSVIDNLKNSPLSDKREPSNDAINKQNSNFGNIFKK